MVTNYKNYGPFAELAKMGTQYVDVSDINQANYDDYFFGLLNIMRDGIEMPEVQNMYVRFKLCDGEEVDLVLTNAWFNLMCWTFLIYLGEPVTTEFLYDTTEITKRGLTEYFNEYIKSYSNKVSFIGLNNLIDETMSKMKHIDDVSLFLANTVNFWDTICLMRQYPEFNSTIHADLNGVPIEDVKNVGMEQTKTQIKYIKESDHCLKDSFISGEAISPKQFKEVSVNIGTKPDGQGGVFMWIINNSFMNGGVSEPESYVTDSSGGRTAQILQKMNVGTSGAFARLLETNNLDTFFNDDKNYACNTKNFIKVFIKDATWLKMYDRRYYRFTPDGFEYVVDKDKDTHLIGQTLYFRSPITCDSYAHGHGICHKCYGDLYNINKDINPGKIAAELLSSVYTQMLLSAKHLLESSVVAMKWNLEFNDIFDVNFNMISVSEDAEISGMKMILDSSLFDSSEEDDDSVVYEEYTPSFDIKYPDGKIVHFHTSKEDNIYITEDLNRLLKSKKVKEEDGIYTIAMELLRSIPVVFTVKIQNKELQRTLERSKHIINRKKDTSSFTKDEIVREFITTNIEGGIHVTAVHLETIIANQMRDPDDIMSMPNWGIPNAPYEILTLNTALNYSPSITVTLEYQKIGDTLVSPMSTKKKKPSIYDLFFMEKPQEFVVNKEMISDDYKMKEDSSNDNMIEGIYFINEDDEDSEDNCNE